MTLVLTVLRVWSSLWLDSEPLYGLNLVCLQPESVLTMAELWSSVRPDCSYLQPEPLTNYGLMLCSVGPDLGPHWALTLFLSRTWLWSSVWPDSGPFYNFPHSSQGQTKFRTMA